MYRIGCPTLTIIENSLSMIRPEWTVLIEILGTTHSTIRYFSYDIQISQNKSFLFITTMIPQYQCVNIRNALIIHSRLHPRACLFTCYPKLIFSQPFSVNSVLGSSFSPSLLAIKQQEERRKRQNDQKGSSSFKWRFSYSGLIINLIPVAVFSVIGIIIARRVKEIFSKVNLFII